VVEGQGALGGGGGADAEDHGGSVTGERGGATEDTEDTEKREDVSTKATKGIQHGRDGRATTRLLFGGGSFGMRLVVSQGETAASVRNAHEGG
jgi:hypothetical protein